MKGLIEAYLVKRRSRGVSLVEAAITLPIVLFFVLAFIDIGRYFYVSATLNYAAFAAADLASKLEVEAAIDTNSCSTESSATCDSIYKTPCKCYLEIVRDKILPKAQSIAATVAAPSSNGNGMVRLVPFAHYAVSDYVGYNLSPKLPSFTADVGFVRPGERISRMINNQKQGEFTYPPPREWGTGSGFGWPHAADAETWGSLLSNNPIIVRIEAEMKLITPGFRPLTIVATQLAYRRTKDVGASVAPPTVPPGETATATPTRTNTPLGWPTATPRPSATPTITPTPVQCDNIQCDVECGCQGGFAKCCPDKSVCKTGCGNG